MKYIRTDGNEIIAYNENASSLDKPFILSQPSHILKHANTIEELCDEFVFNVEDQGHWVINNYKRALEIAKSYNEDKNKFICYGAIWTKWGLKYIAKMNAKGEMKLL